MKKSLSLILIAVFIISFSCITFAQFQSAPRTMTGTITKLRPKLPSVKTYKGPSDIPLSRSDQELCHKYLSEASVNATYIKDKVLIAFPFDPEVPGMQRRVGEASLAKLIQSGTAANNAYKRILVLMDVDINKFNKMVELWAPYPSSPSMQKIMIKAHLDWQIEQKRYLEDVYTYAINSVNPDDGVNKGWVGLDGIDADLMELSSRCKMWSELYSPRMITGNPVSR